MTRSASPKYRYGGKTHRPSEFARRIVEIGQAELVQEGLDAEAARLVMREITSKVWQEFGGQLLNIPKTMAWDGITERDRAIWEASEGSNVPELCRQFDLCDRQVRYVLDFCRLWFKAQHQPELPGLLNEERAA